MVGRILLPAPNKEVHNPIPRICKYVSLYSKQDFVDMIKRLSWDYPGLSKWAQHNHKGP